MSRSNRLLGRGTKVDARPNPRRSSGLGFEPLESRDMLSASPVLMVISNQDFYYREYGDTRAALEAQGLEVVVAAATTETARPHANTGAPAGTSGAVQPDIALADVDADDYSAIAFVGGWGSSIYQYAYNDPNLDGANDNFYSNGYYNGDANLSDGVIASQKIAANNLVNEFTADGKPVAAICHGVTVLAWARVDGSSPLTGKNVAVPHQEGSPDQFYAGEWRSNWYFNGQYDQVLANGGLPTAFSGAHGDPSTTTDDVIVDGNIITAENPASATLFGTRIADQVRADVAAANHPPTAESSTWTIAENTTEGTVIGQVVASDPDAGQTLAFAIASGNDSGAFAIDPATAVVTVANAAALDYETTPVFNLTVGVSDGAGGSTTAAVAIALQDVAEPTTPIEPVGSDFVIHGTPAADTIYIWSGAADNQVYASVNGTTVGPIEVSAGGQVVVLAGDGDDRVFATDLRHDATIEGGAGKDLLLGGSGNDTILGGAGNDTLLGNRGNDIVLGQDGNDLLIVNNGDGSDFLEGGEGWDSVRVNGSDGDDRFVIAPTDTGVRLTGTGAESFSLNFSKIESVDVNARGGNDIIVGSVGLAGVVALDLDGGEGNDLLIGGDGVDVLRGGAGNDVLLGSAATFDEFDLGLMQAIWLGDGDTDSRAAALAPMIHAGVVDDGVRDHLCSGDGEDFTVSGQDDTVYYPGDGDRGMSV